MQIEFRHATSRADISRAIRLKETPETKDAAVAVTSSKGGAASKTASLSGHAGNSGREQRAAGKALRERATEKPTPRGMLLTTGEMPWRWSWRRRKGACRTCCRCATGAWSAPLHVLPRGGARDGRRSGVNPRDGIHVQCCGDAHLCNFGGFATPERRVIFSINDLDETLPAPWEWDVKRLAASFVVACRDNGLKEPGQGRGATCVRTYRESMADSAR